MQVSFTSYVAALEIGVTMHGILSWYSVMVLNEWVIISTISVDSHHCGVYVPVENSLVGGSSNLKILSLKNFPIYSSF